MKWTEYRQAKEIPPAWDSLAGSCFLKREFLDHLERTNPCRQHYRMLFHDGTPLAIYVFYRLKLDIFTYSTFRLKIPVWIIGIPCSIGKQGFAVREGMEEILTADIRSIKGAKLILNADTVLPGKMGDTLPSAELTLKWRDFDHYLSSMRSHYRYRWRKALAKWKDVKIDLVPAGEFDPVMYQQYETVYERSRYKLEKLKLDFFRHLPESAKIMKGSINDQLLGYAVIMENQDELVFLFTGFDYRLNHKYDTYLNLLLEIASYGLKNNFRVIDFGQTTEGTKQKLGCILKKKKMYLYHSNPVIDTLANMFISVLEYQPPQDRFTVFK
jgi:hypothetical protein